MKFSYHAAALLNGAVIAAFLTISVMSNKIFSSMTSFVEDGQLQLMKAIVNDALQHAENEAIGRAEIIAEIPQVQSLFAAHNRPKLLAELQSVFNLQKEKYGVDQAHFHLPPGISFLRLHKPELFGDDLTSYHTMVMAVNREQVHKAGITIERTGPGMFGVVPVFDSSHNFIGSFEIVIDFPNIFDSLKTTYGFDIAVFIQEEPLKATATAIQAGIFSDQNRLGEYIRYYSTNTALFKALVNDKDLNRVHGNRYVREALGVYYGVQVVPLINENDKVIGRIVVVKDFSASRSSQNRAIVWQVLMALFAITLISGLIHIIIRGVFLKPLRALTNNFSYLVDNDGSPEQPVPDKLCQELEELAHQYDRLRKVNVKE